MPIVPEPDFIGAVVGRLRSISDVTALTSTRISGQLQDDWFPGQTTAQHAVLVRRASGTDEPELDHFHPRLDIRCYGANEYEAGRLARIVKPALCPTRASGNPTSFTQGGCRVIDVAYEAGPFGSQEPETKWWFVQASYRFRVSAVPVP
jgi:hypothetical protein